MYRDISKDRMSTTEKDYTDLAIRETDHVYIDISLDRMSSQERDYTDLGNRETEHMYGDISKDEKNAPENNYTDLTDRGTEHMYGDISKDGIVVPENDYTNLGNRKAEHIYGSLKKHVVNDEAKPRSGAFLTAKIRLIAFVSIFVMFSVTSVVVIVLLTQNSGEESTISTQSTSDYITGTTKDIETTTHSNKQTLNATQFLAPNTTNKVSVTTGQLPAKTTELTTPPTSTAIIEGSILSWVDWTSRYIPVQFCSQFASSPPWEQEFLCRPAWYPYRDQNGYIKDGYKVCKAKFKVSLGEGHLLASGQFISLNVTSYGGNESAIANIYLGSLEYDIGRIDGDNIICVEYKCSGMYDPGFENNFDNTKVKVILKYNNSEIRCVVAEESEDLLDLNGITQVNRSDGIYEFVAPDTYGSINGLYSATSELIGKVNSVEALESLQRASNLKCLSSDQTTGNNDVVDGGYAAQFTCF